MINRALISLTDKNWIEEFASQLEILGVEILSTGGTAKKIRDAGITVVEVSDFTGFPEMFDGRIKTLHPRIHGGILYQRKNPAHQSQRVQHSIWPIDLVVVNLYPFEKTVANPACTLEDAIENIDIGGPTMLRAAAKNYNDVTVVVDPADYRQVISELRTNGSTTLSTRFELAKKVFAVTSVYDTAISQWLSKRDHEGNVVDSQGVTLSQTDLNNITAGS
jgi:phosphoribosylaminoimidazolecarboxamide formyltransferase/IMP cyclohydrolase